MSLALNKGTGVHVTSIKIHKTGDDINRNSAYTDHINVVKSAGPISNGSSSGMTVSQHHQTMTHTQHSGGGGYSEGTTISQHQQQQQEHHQTVTRTVTTTTSREEVVYPPHQTQTTTHTIITGREGEEEEAPVTQVRQAVIQSVNTQQQEQQQQQQGASYISGQVTSVAEVQPWDVSSHQVVSEVHHVSSAAIAEAKKNIDEVLPATSVWTTHRDGTVKLKVTATGPGSDTPITVPTFVRNIVNKIPNNVALAVKRNGEWVKWTYAAYLNDIYTVAKAFMKLGLEPHNGVGIMGFNSPEWFLSELGCIFAGGLATGIYTTNSPEACLYVADSCRANVIVVENNQQLQKILQVKDRLPHLKAIVQYSGDVAVREDFIYSWAEFMAKGKEVSDEMLQQRMKSLAPNKCCILIYTSGTTGNPKGVMLSHDNITWTARMVYRSNAAHLKLVFGDMSIVSYLPLSHIAAQMLDIFATISYGGTVYFAQPDALKGSLVYTLREVRPHALLGVPRVWEKMQESIQNSARNIKGLKKKVSTWAKGVGLKGNRAMLNGERPPMGFGLADKLVFKKARHLLGMDRCQIRLSGAAPITHDTLEYFMSLNLPLCEIYGMSECTGPQTTGYPTMNRIGSVGREFEGVTTVLDKMDGDGNGEVVMHGRHVFMGYLNEVEKTREALDDVGGLHSGDIGKKDKDGFLYITGRIKELIITAGGENIPPVAIEDMVKSELPVVSNCMLIGDKKKFLSMMLTLKTEVDPETQEPKDALTPAALDWVKSVGSSATTVTEILEPGDRAVLQSIQRGIDVVNHKAVSNAQRIQKWSLLPNDFSVPGGELGPTMKMRRPIIVKMYSKTISAFYEDANPSS